uniref:Transmembrane protein 63C n=1 Tax=Chelonoidis abingdonii TaxID=106734 RepID=A0A8C0JDT1_CHEAB
MYLAEPAPGGASPVSLDVLSFLDPLANSTEEQCFSARSRSTVLQGLPFGGVPTVLAINFILWLLLLLVFSCLRKAAWDYGRLALSLPRGWWHPPSVCERAGRGGGFCSWLISIYQMKDEELQSKCGIDATTYLSFQRHILVLVMIVCVLSVAVILPVNFSGDLLGRSVPFFLHRDRLLWLHSIFALIYFIITIFCMAHHSVQLEYKEDEKVSCPSALLPLPTQRETLHNFACLLPSVLLKEPHVLCDPIPGRRKAMKGRLYFTTKAQKEGKIMIKTHPCARIFCCRSCSFEQVDAEQYYGELEEKLTDEFNAERNRISLKRLDMAFVTFQDDRMTAVILKDYSRIHCRRHPQQSSVTTVVKSHSWGVRYAPAPSDIIWENLSVRGTSWWVRFVLLNFCLFILLFFLTTPAIIVNTIDMFNVTRPVESLKNPVLTQFFPTLLLWAFSVFLPFVVYYSAFFESHWTRSNENQVTMHKCYFFLVFMVIILPSLGLTSLDLFFHWLFDIHFLDEANIKFQCVFLPDNGAFFVNYVITSSLIGTAMELLRIPSLIVYATRLCFAKSEPERLHIKRSQAYEFQFGLEYAWTCCIFAVVMTYSITCPIIVPFGLLYMLLKHMVDRYNIYYVYIPTKLNQRIHSAAVSQVVVAPIFCMFWLLFFSVLRLGPIRPITLFTFVVLLSCILFSFFGLLGPGFLPDPHLWPIVCFVPQMFVATVLQEPELSLTPAASPAHQSYGTMGNRLEPVENSEEGGLQSFETELETVEGEFRTGPVLEEQVHYH